MRTARRGIHICASLQAADGDDRVPPSDSDGEGAGSPAQDSVGALERGDNATSAQPDEGGMEEVGWQLLRQKATQITLARDSKAGASKVFKNFQKCCQQKFRLHAKTHLARQLEFQKLPQRGKDQCLPLAALEVQGVPRVSPQPKLPRRVSTKRILEATVESLTAPFASG